MGGFGDLFEKSFNLMRNKDWEEHKGGMISP
jgi:hypothetical protein